jgi:GTP-binding protein
VIDATEGVSEQDARIAGMAIERGRAVCVALNKIDKMDAEARDKAHKRAKDVLAFMSWAPIKRISARSGHGVAAMMKSVREVTACHRKRVTTGNSISQRTAPTSTSFVGSAVSRCIDTSSNIVDSPI